ncbi:MAG TPA: DUF5677 domain-containing protein [Acidobacteriaceae bacterium]|nr:DUF5677 domain-containing protein [Acidobacteriaceae bacterium]
MKATDAGVCKPETWDDIVNDHPKFPELMAKWLRLIGVLLQSTEALEGDDLGLLISGFMFASAVDINDVLTLTHRNSRSGAPKLLRSAYERIVTMKYLAANPTEVPKFIGYQSIDRQQIIDECASKLGEDLTEPARSNLANAAKQARQEYKAEVCPHCNMRKQTNWTPRTVKQLADATGMSHMHFHSYVLPSKMMHTTFYGTMEFMKSAAPTYNILNCAHELIVHNVLTHRRHFAKAEYQPTPMMKEVAEDYLRIWVYAETSFEGMLLPVRS